MEKEVLPTDLPYDTAIKNGRLGVKLGVENNRWYIVNVLAHGVLPDEAKEHEPVAVGAEITGEKLIVQLESDDSQWYPVNLGAENALIEA